MINSVIQNPALFSSLPNTWDIATFDALFDTITPPKKFKKSSYIDEGVYPIVDQGDELIGGYTNNNIGIIEASQPLIIFGDHTRKFKYIDFDFAAGADGTKIISCNKKIEPKYAYYFFHTLNLPNDGYSRHFKYLKKIKVPLPQLKVQQQIVEILDEADAMQKKREKTIEKLAELKEAIFYEIFGDPASNPKNWDEITLDKLVEDTKNGLYLPKEKYNVEGTPMVHMSDAFSDVVTPEVEQSVELTKDDLEKYQLNNNDLLIARRSLVLEGAAKASIVRNIDNNDLVFESSLIRVRPNQTKIDSEYLLQFFNNTRSKNKYVKPYITQSTISGINQTNLLKISVLTPPIELQTRYRLLIESIDDNKKSMINSKEVTNILFRSLLQKAFIGGLNV